MPSQFDEGDPARLRQLVAIRRQRHPARASRKHGSRGIGTAGRRQIRVEDDGPGFRPEDRRVSSIGSGGIRSRQETGWASVSPPDRGPARRLDQRANQPHGGAALVVDLPIR
jgi:hypothetical protein